MPDFLHFHIVAPSSTKFIMLSEDYPGEDLGTLLLSASEAAQFNLCSVCLTSPGRTIQAVNYEPKRKWIEAV
jgi:hypothetical protein